jgi:hypothetical protein
MKSRLSPAIAGICAIFVIFAFIACGGDDGETVHEHQWGDWIVTTAPTCTTAGIETKTCKQDSTHTETRTGADALGHNWGNWIVTTPATTTAEGEETKTCSTCGEKETKPIEKLVELTGSVTISGTPNVGQTLEAVIADDHNAPNNNFTYQWIRGNEAIAGIEGKGQTYTVIIDDLGETLKVDVTHPDMGDKIFSAATATVGPDPATIPHSQEQELTGLFETSVAYPDGYSTTITGNFSDNDWYGVGEEKGVAEKIETALNDAFNSLTGLAGNQLKNRFRSVFGELGFNIEVVKPSEDDGWSKWKASLDDLYAKKFFLGFDELDNGLQQSITDAVRAADTGQPGMAKAAPAKNTIRLAGVRKKVTVTRVSC